MSEEKNLNEEEMNETVEAEAAVEETAAEAAVAEETAEEEAVEAEAVAGETAEEEAVEAEAVAEETAEEETVEEAAEEAVGEFVAAESAESVLGETNNEVDGQNMNNPFDEVAAENMVDTSKKAVVAVIIAVAAVIVAALVILLVVMGPKWFNKYNRSAVNVTDRTIAEVADQAGMSLNEFKEEYELPKDMPANTYEWAAYSNMPFTVAVEIMYNGDMEYVKELLHLEDVPEDATYMEVMETVPVKYMIAEGQIDTFKESYGFGDEVTEDTLWGEIRLAVEEKDRQANLEEKNASTSSDE